MVDVEVVLRWALPRSFLVRSIRASSPEDLMASCSGVIPLGTPKNKVEALFAVAGER